MKMIDSQYDPITGKKLIENPLNKKHLSKIEYDEIFNNFFDSELIDTDLDEYEEVEYSSQECYN